MRLRTFVFFFVLHSTAATLGAQVRANAYVDFTIGANLSIGNLPNDGEYNETKLVPFCARRYAARSTARGST